MRMTIYNRIGSYMKERKAIRELSSMTERELSDLGITRCDIRKL